MLNILFGIVGTVLVVIWFVLLISSGKKYEEHINVLDGNEYFLKDLYGIGYQFIYMSGIDINNGYFQKRINKMSEMYGKRYARFVVLSDFAAQMTFALTFLPISFLVTVIAGDISIFVIALALIGFLIFNVVYDKNTKINERHESILRDFPHMLSQMALLINAGMPLRDAIGVASKKEVGVLYEEMRTLNDDIKNGVPEYEAMREFADRCGVDEVRKLSSLIVQNVKKGSSELAAAMMDLSDEVWRRRTSQVREQGEKASSKLLIPILIIFGGIIVMVVVPIFRNMGI